MTSKLFLGTSGWSYKDWINTFYPADLKPKDYLGFYTSKFTAVEIDATFYRIPSAKMVSGWYQNSPEHFIFSPKLPQKITHEKRLQNCSSELTAFLTAISILEEKLGPLVLQFDYAFTPEFLPQLTEFLPQLPSTNRYAVEIRNRKWYECEAFFNLLEKYKCAFVLQDLYYMPKFFRLTAPFTYIRLLGNRKLIPDDFSHVRLDREEALNDWARRIVELLNEGIEVYAFANNRYQGHAPETIINLQQKIQQHNEHRHQFRFF